MIKTQLACMLAFNRISGLGPSKIAKLTAQFADLSDCFSLSTAELTQLGFNDAIISQFHTLNWQTIEEELIWAQKANHFIICKSDEAYPPLLQEIPSAPPVLFIKGDLSYLKNAPSLAMVGSRTPTSLGADMAFHFSRCLAKAGFCIVSGLALGIDSCSHRGALQQLGGTIAVMATGIDTIYPAKNQQLAAQIIESGALITEFPLGTLPKTTHFPRRNRLISGLSLGILVVEATLRSGSLITAQQAVEQGREVFAIPGSIHNPLSKGCHELIRQGAKLVETVDHILEELKHHVASPTLSQKNSAQHLENDEQNLVKFIGYEATAIDTLVRRSGLASAEVMRQLSDLELKGLVCTVPGGYMRSGPGAQDL